MLQNVNEGGTDDTTFQGTIHAGMRESWLNDHVVNGHVVFPGAAYLDMAFAALHRRGEPGEDAVIEDAQIVQPLVVSEKDDGKSVAIE